MIGTVQTLMTGLIDYAGLFPPAGLGMNEAVANYARDLGGTDAFALSKFICPASRLDELSESARVLVIGGGISAAQAALAAVRAGQRADLGRRRRGRRGSGRGARRTRMMLPSCPRLPARRMQG